MAARVSRLMKHDLARLAAGRRALVGVDEAGRGALAGPVVAGCVYAPAAFYEGEWFRRRARLADDSKKLEPALRAELNDEILALREAGALYAATGAASVAEIEERNILGATQLAMGRALREVFQQVPVDVDGEDSLLAAVREQPAAGDSGPEARPIRECEILVDGRPLRHLGHAHTAIVGGDGRSLVIAMASILAKVARDRAMEVLDTVCPGYGLATHKGYATPEHREAILRLGVAPCHRDKFLRRLLAAGQPEGEGQLDLSLEEEPV